MLLLPATVIEAVVAALMRVVVVVVAVVVAVVVVVVVSLRFVLSNAIAEKTSDYSQKRLQMAKANAGSR